MDRIAAGEIQKVAVYSLDRLARTLHQIVAIAEAMRQHGAELLVVNVPMSAEGPSGNHRPIVTRDVFDQVQDRIADRRTGDRQRARSSTGALASRGRIACPSCGRFPGPHMRMVKTSKQASVAMMTYRCRSHAGGRPPCRGTAVTFFAIEGAVMEMVGDDELPSRCSGMKRSEMRRFQALWAAVDASERRNWLSRLVERVEIDRAAGGIRVTVDEEAMRAFAAGHPTSRGNAGLGSARYPLLDWWETGRTVGIVPWSDYTCCVPP